MNALVIANTQIRRDADNRYCLNDLHQASGADKRHQPANWLRMDKTTELVAEIERSDETVPQNRGTVPALITLQGGAVQGTYAVKELVYAYAMWISAKFHLHVIRAYDAMVRADRPSPPAIGDGVGPSHHADIMVGASRGFGALVRAGRVMGLGRTQAIRAANDATLRATGINLVDELGADGMLVAQGHAGLDVENSVASFHQAMQAGDIDAPYQYCLSRSAFYLYQYWCSVQGLTAAAMPRFLHCLRVEQGVRVERRRYVLEGQVFGPVSILTWGTAPAKTPTACIALGQSVAAFEAALAKILRRTAA